jgi:Mitochondrial small ribosomal subunit Rsm22
MTGPVLARPLEEDWQDALDGVARSRGWPTTRDVARLARRVIELSAAYNDPGRARAAAREAGAARLGFSFPRDVPKGAAAVRELVASGALPLDRTLRVLDLGAGLGATTWGLARALAAAGFAGAIEATWVDADADALELATSILRARGGREGGVELRARTRSGTAAGAAPGRFDVVLVGQLLSELDVASPDDVRRQRHAALLRTLLDERTEERGALVVIEPALRDRARHLHAVRNDLASGGATIFAPCLHAAPCPALAREPDWCHEDLAIDLPEWLVPVARAAGLRREGLTFSYLVLHRGPRRLVDAVVAPAGAARLRVVSGEIRSKGKVEAYTCGELPGPDGPVAARARLMRLDRDRTPGNSAWDGLARGDVLVITPPPELERPRITAASTVAIAVTAARASSDELAKSFTRGASTARPSASSDPSCASAETGLLAVSECGDAESR